MASSHSFTSPVLAYAKYYCGFLPLEGFEAIFRQLPFKLSEVNSAVEEVMAFADTVKKTDSSKSTKIDTAIPKLYRYVMKLLNDEVKASLGVSEFNFLMNAGDLKHVPGHSPRVLCASTDMMLNVMAATSTSVASISQTASSNQNVDSTEPDCKQQQPDPVPGPSTRSKSKSPAESKSVTKETHRWQEVKPKKKSKQKAKVEAKKDILKPKPAIPSVLKDFRLYIGAGDLDVTERHIRKWAHGWKVHDGKLKVTRITKRSFVCEFQSRNRHFTAPAGVRCEKFRRKGLIIPLTERKVATKLYVAGVPTHVPEDEALEEIYSLYNNVDKSLTEILPLPRAKSANSGNYCFEKRYYVKLVSERNGEEPKFLGGTSPFKIRPWLSWRRQPSRLPTTDTNVSGKDGSTNSPEEQRKPQGLLRSAFQTSKNGFLPF